MPAGAVEQRAETAACKSDDLKARTVAPSELVPSGNRTTSRPDSIAARICERSVFAVRRRLRTTKIVPPARASQPNKGQARTSRFATKTHGRKELNAIISR